MTPAQREDLVSKLRKLAKLTTTNGCTEGEAHAAAAKLASLMAEHNIAQDELSIRADANGCITDEFITLSRSRADWFDCLGAIGKLFQCRVWSSNRYDPDYLGLGLGGEHIMAVKFFGFEVDVVAALAMTLIITTALDHETKLWRKAKGKDQPKANTFAFRAGMIHGLSARLGELHMANQPVATGTGLLVLKNQLVNDEFAKLGLSLRSTAARTRSVDGAAYRDGQAAAQGVKLRADAQVSRGNLAIGRG